MRRTTLAFLLLLALAASADEFSYMLSRDGTTIISGNVDISHIERINGRLDPPYLWARRGGKEYLIRHVPTLAAAQAVFRDSDGLHAEYERLRARMEPVEQQENDIEEEMDDLSDDLSDRDDLSGTQRSQMEKRVEELERRLGPVRKQLRALEAEEERLDAREEQLTAAAEKKLRDVIDRAIASGLAQPAR
jgi:chromosome segregation ATPase